MSSTDFFPVDSEVLDAVSQGSYHAPHDVLGAHPHSGGVTVRAIRRLADDVFIETKAGRTRAQHEHNGIWRAVIEAESVPDYRVVAVYGGVEDTSDDPYRFLPTVGEMDMYLFSEGRHERLWDVLGSHMRSFDSELGQTTGASFTVWAPNAKAVRVVGDFNGWDGSTHAMRSLGESGIWEIFIPEACEGARYKYEIQYEDLTWHLKADPMARRSEIPPATASIITDSHFEWSDDQWLAKRNAGDNHGGPISIYEMHLGSWRPGLDYRSAAEQLIGHLTYCGFTHVEFMPLAEHPFTPSWGYQVTGYYSPTARFGSPDDLRYLINELHKAGIGVIIDWVPAHFPKDEWALARFDGTALYEDPNPLRAEHPDWGTYVFNYGRREVRNFLVANALYWCEEFHIDGIRVDAVASMLYLDYSRSEGQWQPNVYGGRENLEAISFIQEVTATTYRKNPGVIMVAEESTSWPGVTDVTDNDGLGFGLKWNMGWMNDTLRYLEEKPINRKWHHNEITFSLVYAFSEQFLLPLSHDEVVHGKGSLYQKMPGDAWQKLAGVRELFAYQWSHPGKKLLFMGQEFAQIEEWNESRGLDWWLTDDPAHDGVLSLVKRLNEVYREHRALWEEDFSPAGFEWIVPDDSDSNVIAYLRKSSDGSDVMAIVCNFSGIPRIDYRLGLPRPGRWREVVNTDAIEYGGSGVGNLGSVHTENKPWHGHSYSACLQLPPFGVLYLVPGGNEETADAGTDTTSVDDSGAVREPVDEGTVAENTTPAPAPAPVSVPVVVTPGSVTEAATDDTDDDVPGDEVPTVDEGSVTDEPTDDINETSPDDTSDDTYDDLPVETSDEEGVEEESSENLTDDTAVNDAHNEGGEPSYASVDNPWLGMPGVLPFVDPHREPLGNYTIIEHDYTDIALAQVPAEEVLETENGDDMSEPSSVPEVDAEVTSAPALETEVDSTTETETGDETEPETVPEYEGDTSSDAEGLNDEANILEPEAVSEWEAEPDAPGTIDYSANADGIYLQPRDWLDPMASAESADEFSEGDVSNNDELDSPYGNYEDLEVDTQSLIEAAQSAANEFLSVPPAVQSLEENLTEESTYPEQSTAEESHSENTEALIGTVLNTVNGAGILPLRHIPPAPSNNE